VTSTEQVGVRATEWMLESAGRFRRTTTVLPVPAEGEILVASLLGAVSPGMERALLHGTCPAVPQAAYPRQPGYLNIVEIREAHDRTLVGERGIALLGHRDYALVPYHRFVRIAPGVSDEAALLGVLTADARHAIEIASVDLHAECLVLGGGILGVLTAWELCARTRAVVRLVETDPARRELVSTIRFPGEVVVAEDVGRAQFSTVFECAGSAAAFLQAQESTRPKGSIVVIADGSHEDYVLGAPFFAKSLILGKTDSNPDLRSFLAEWFARHEDRSTLVAAAFQDEVRFVDFPQAYLEALLATPGTRRGLLPRVRYGEA
jgi:2-desacetyl-2-hydroxyethyl bacteriochlorophyllide A dehydrogenase